MTAHQGRHPKLALFWKIVSISFGWALILLGVAGLFLPILQGWLMILAGLAVLSPYSRRARAVLHWLREKLRIRWRHPADQPAAPDQHEAHAEHDERDRRARM